jgi:hypothetical protein
MRLLAVTLDDADPKTMRETVDRMKDKLKSAPADNRSACTHARL